MVKVAKFGGSSVAGAQQFEKVKAIVNGHTAMLGDSADIDTDKVCVDGRLLGRRAENTYIMLNKPRVRQPSGALRLVQALLDAVVAQKIAEIHTPPYLLQIRFLL